MSYTFRKMQTRTPHNDASEIDQLSVNYAQRHGLVKRPGQSDSKYLPEVALYLIHEATKVSDIRWAELWEMPAMEILRLLDPDLAVVAPKKGMLPSEIESEAIALIAKRAKRGQSFKSCNELAEAVGCSPSARTIKRVWSEYGTPEQAVRAEHLHDGIEDQDATLNHLIAQQEAERRADGLPRRIQP